MNQMDHLDHQTATRREYELADDNSCRVPRERLRLLALFCFFLFVLAIQHSASPYLVSPGTHSDGDKIRVFALAVGNIGIPLISLVACLIAVRLSQAASMMVTPRFLAVYVVSMVVVGLLPLAFQLATVSCSMSIPSYAVATLVPSIAIAVLYVLPNGSIRGVVAVLAAAAIVASHMIFCDMKERVSSGRIAPMICLCLLIIGVGFSALRVYLGAEESWFRHRNWQKLAIAVGMTTLIVMGWLFACNKLCCYLFRSTGDERSVRVTERFPHTGQLMESGSRLDGKRHGKWSEWHENGNIQSVTYWKNGVLHGMSSAWDEDGCLIVTRYFVENKEVTRSEYLAACAKDPTLPKPPDDPKKPSPDSQKQE